MKRSEFSPKTKAQAFLRCNGKCENKHCGIKLTQDTVNYDHKVSDKICREQGIKSNTLDNCQCLCVPCHTVIKNRADMAEIVKRRKQDKKYGDAADGGVSGLASPPKNKSKWQSAKMKSSGFNYPANYKHWS